MFSSLSSRVSLKFCSPKSLSFVSSGVSSKSFTSGLLDVPAAFSFNPSGELVGLGVSLSPYPNLFFKDCILLSTNSLPYFS